MAPLGWLLCGMPPLYTFLEVHSIFSVWSGLGLEYGLCFGFLMYAITSFDDGKKSFSKQLQLIQSLRLNTLDILFLSLCAGIGEEILFRVALQQWVTPLLASFIFVAIHGYIIPTDWSTTKFGLLVFVFISVLGFAVSSEQGLWFCIFAHAGYDFVLFHFWSKYQGST
jgi:membrane protease YdiL (CAAX protease family)